MALSWINTLLPPARLEDTALVDSIVQMVERKSIDIFARQVNALLNRPDEISLLPGIRCPVLSLSGYSDPLSRPEANHEMADAISGSHLAILQECGHMAPQEQPGEVNRCLLELLERE